MNVKTFKDTNELKNYFGFKFSGDILENNLHLIENNTDLNDRKFHDAEVLTTLTKNLGGNCLEIGTSFGNGTYKIATNTEGTVFTLNALPEQMSGHLVTHSIPKEKIGSYLINKGIKNFFQFYSDSLSWTVPENVKDLSIVFIDGCHDAKYVYLDSKKTVSLLKQGGFMIWHDFNPSLRNKFSWINAAISGVESFCKENGIKEVYHLKDSWMGFWRKT